MHSDRRRGMFIFHSISQLVTTALMIGVLPALAQNTTPLRGAVPATARQAATMPAFASRLASRAGQQSPQRATRKHPALLCSQMDPGSPQYQILYENGPVNGQVDAWTVNFGFAVTNSVQLASQVTGLAFYAWVIPGDTISSVEVQFGSAPFGNDLFDGFVSLTQSSCSSNQFGYNVCVESGNFAGPTLGGNAWITLQNANVPSGDPVYWDENSGVGCTSAGCPSQAQENTIGTIPSEAFSILGVGTTTSTTTTTYPQNYCVPEQSGSFKVIHDFTNNGDGGSPSGVAIDRSGNLYGATQQGGSGAGTVYKLAQTASSWVLNTLYNLLGGSNGSSPQGVIVGPHDNLYGAALGGIQNCWNGDDCGIIFQLRPSPTACPAISCSWTETVPYSFTGLTDAFGGGNLVSDQFGNLYGVSEWGGTQQNGAVFELTPTLGGWAESILYNFTGTSDGGRPTTLVVGNDGNLYGIGAWGGTNNRGVVFQLTPSAGGWNEMVLYSLSSSIYGGASNPHSLQQDSAGNLFGIYEVRSGEYNNHGVVFELSPSNGNWVFTQLIEGSVNWDGNDLFPNMILDAAGNLVITENATPACPSGYDYADIFELERVNGWQYRSLVGWSHTYWGPRGNLALDAQGNLYGADAYCGSYGRGSVWELTSSH